MNLNHSIRPSTPENHIQQQRRETNHKQSTRTLFFMIIEPKIPKSNSNPLTISGKTKELRYIMAKRALPEFIVEPTSMNNGISAVNRRRNSPEK